MPAPTANLVGHYIAGVEITSADAAGRVSAWADQSGAGIPLTQTATIDQPYTGLDGFGHPVVRLLDTEFLSAARALPTRDLAVWVVLRAHSGFSGSLFSMVGGSASAGYLRISQPAGGAPSWYGANRGSAALRPNMNISLVGANFTSAATTIHDGQTSETLGAITNFGTPATGIEIGRFSTGYIRADIYEILIYSLAQSPEDQVATKTYLVGKYGIPTYNKLIVFEGSSTPSGSGSTNAQSFPFQVMNSAEAIGWHGMNSATSGATALTMAAETTLDGLYSVSRARNVLLTYVGRNDVQDKSAADAYTDYDSYVTAKVAVGFEVWPATIHAVENPVLQAKIAELNNRLRGVIGSGIVADAGANRVVDVAANPLLDPYIATYSADGTHPNNAGHTLIANKVTQELADAPADVAPTITSASNKAGQVGAALSYTITATGTAPITFGVSGTLPDGVTFDGTDTISGTPTTAGVRVATITATNSAGEDSDTLTFTIAAASEPGAAPANLSLFNQLAEAVGAAGGHRYNLDALNAISQQLTGGAGHTRNLAALNAIAGFYIGTPQTFTLNIDALNAITGKLGAASNNTRTVDALAGWLGKL